MPKSVKISRAGGQSPESNGLPDMGEARRMGQALGAEYIATMAESFQATLQAGFKAFETSLAESSDAQEGVAAGMIFGDSGEVGNGDAAVMAATFTLIPRASLRTQLPPSEQRSEPKAIASAGSSSQASSVTA